MATLLHTTNKNSLCSHELAFYRQTARFSPFHEPLYPSEVLFCTKSQQFPQSTPKSPSRCLDQEGRLCPGRQKYYFQSAKLQKNCTKRELKVTLEH